MRVLRPGAMEAGQERAFTVEAQGLASGVYLIRITGTVFTAPRPVLLGAVAWSGAITRHLGINGSTELCRKASVAGSPD